jgi:multidrug efflux pump subunit AcrB
MIGWKPSRDRGWRLMTLQLLDKTPPKEVPEQFYQARKKLADEARKLPQGAIGPFVNDEYSDVSFALYSVESSGFSAPQTHPRCRRTPAKIPTRAGSQEGGHRGRTAGEDISSSFPIAADDAGHLASDIFSALSRQNAVTPAGSVDTHGAQVFVRLDGAYTDIDKIRDTPIVAGKQSFKLSDIADVTRGYEDPATFVIRHNGESVTVAECRYERRLERLDLGDALRGRKRENFLGPPIGSQPRKNHRSGGQHQFGSE